MDHDRAPDQTRRRMVETMLATPIVLGVPSLFGLDACASQAQAAGILAPTFVLNLP